MTWFVEMWKHQFQNNKANPISIREVNEMYEYSTWLECYRSSVLGACKLQLR